MSTRSLTAIVDGESKKEVCVIYRHSDGYPSGHGADLKAEFGATDIVNGIGLVPRGRKIANGVECFAAQLVAHFKDGPGGIYLYPARQRDCGEDYIYTLTVTREQPIELKVQSVYGLKRRRLVLLYSGALADFDAKACELAEAANSI